MDNKEDELINSIFADADKEIEKQNGSMFVTETKSKQKNVLRSIKRTLITMVVLIFASVAALSIIILNHFKSETKKEIYQVYLSFKNELVENAETDVDRYYIEQINSLMSDEDVKKYIDDIDLVEVVKLMTGTSTDITILFPDDKKNEFIRLLTEYSETKNMVNTQDQHTEESTAEIRAENKNNAIASQK